MSTSPITLIPLDLRKEFSDYNVPCGISERIFNKMKSQEARGIYKRVKVIPSDPEWHFVWRYFHHDKPNKYGIKRIYCINKIQQQKAFELNLSSMEREAKTFQPTWNQEPRVKQRTKAIELWKKAANVFSPFSTNKNNERENFEYAKIIPLWHISSKAVCNSGSESGFIYFGKTSEAESQNNDYDFSENGIYFTNSARYASDYNEKNLFLAWVSMKEPFPIVGDSKSDIENFKETYKDYNAYYVPVTSMNYFDNNEHLYYSTQEKPHCGEFVVFHKSQTLPRFYLELELEIPYVPSDTPKRVNELISHIMKLLQNADVNSDQKLRNYLYKELESLFTLGGDSYLEERHSIIYGQLTQLLDAQGKVNRQVSCALTEIHNSATIESPFTQSTQPSTSPTSDTLVNPHPCNIPASFTPPTNPTDVSYAQVKSYSSVVGIAFGKTDWEKYFGEIGEEPLLPKNVKRILNKSCPFWPNKKVKETHLLVLIPNTVNGQPFTLSFLGELIQCPRAGYKTQFFYGVSDIKESVRNKSYPSHWVLMTKDLIPGSTLKGYSPCCELLANYSKKVGLHYELPNLLDAVASILLHYVKTGERLYDMGDNSCSEMMWSSKCFHCFTYCQEDVCPWIVGGFSPVGGGLRIRSCSKVHIFGSAGACIFPNSTTNFTDIQPL